MTDTGAVGPTGPLRNRRPYSGTHQVIDADFHSDPDEKLEDATRQGLDEMMAATYVAGVLEAQEVDAEEGIVDRIALRRAMASLYTVEREIMELVAVQGMTLDEAARRLGVHVNTAQKRQANALRKLRKYFAARGWRPG